VLTASGTRTPSSRHPPRVVHARDRGAETWWKSFTTGKSAQLLGGVPHDTYGMTSISIRQFVLGIYKQLGLREKDITKVQTGGPDGDLGSSKSMRFDAAILGLNVFVDEILLSSDKTIAIIDGSGVLADPSGINREELIRLARLRVPVSHFDRSKLSKDGYLVRIEDRDTKLPCKFDPVVAFGYRFSFEPLAFQRERWSWTGQISVMVLICVSRLICLCRVVDG
jgi:NAD-specific glutamate dehydrogenase